MGSPPSGSGCAICFSAPDGFRHNRKEMIMLTGWKTYLAAAALALSGLLEGLLGVDIPGVTVADNWMILLFGALGLTGLRAAITK